MRARHCLGVVLAMALAGCVSLPALPPPPPAQIVQLPACPKLIDWTPGEQKQLKAEYDALPADDPMKKAIKDYIALRDETRACLKADNGQPAPDAHDIH